MNHWNKNHYQPKKKVFTIDQIKEDIDFSIFVTRLFYVGYSLDWVCMNTHKMKQSNINDYVSKLKELGLITITNITKANENLIECLNKQHPNYYKNVDFKTDVIYLKTISLFSNKNLMLDIKDKWKDNEYFNTAYLQIEQEYVTTQYLLTKLKETNSAEGTRSKSFPDGTTIQIETSKQKQLNMFASQEKKFSIGNNKVLEIEERKGTALTLKQTNDMLALKTRESNEILRENAKRDNLDKQVKEDFKEIARNKLNDESDFGIDRQADKINKDKIKEIKGLTKKESGKSVLDIIMDESNESNKVIDDSYVKIKEKVKKIEVTRDDKDKKYLLNKIKMGCKISKKAYEKNYGAVEE